MTFGKRLSLLDKMKESDHDMDVRFKIDGGGRIVHMLWSTGRNKAMQATRDSGTQ